MRVASLGLLAGLLVGPPATVSAQAQSGGGVAPPAVGFDPDGDVIEEHPGEPLDRADYGPFVYETWDQVLQREAERERLGLTSNRKARGGRPGVWMVPPRGAMSNPIGGRNITNQWGDLEMGLAFPQVVDFTGVWVGGQSAAGVWPPALRVVGYREGARVAASEWYTAIDATPSWLAADLENVDRVVFEAQAAFGAQAFYTLDDLEYFVKPTAPDAEGARVVLDFEDLAFEYRLSGSGYAGLTWEESAAPEEDGIHAPIRPQVPGGLDEHPTGDAPQTYGGAGTAPSLGLNFQTLKRGDNGQSSYPPDTCGAVGDSHFVTVVNTVFGIWNKSGTKISSTSLGSFQPGTSGDPRVAYDHFEDRWIVMSTNFNNRIYLAYSATSNPSGGWFKTNFVISAGSDSGCWPDFPTLGYDENGIYVGAYMVGCGMTLVAIDKAPLLSGSPSLGTVTAFRNLTYEGALQPCHTWGSPGHEFIVSTNSSNRIRVRRLSPPLTSPTLSTIATPTVGTHPDPPTAPVMGSGTNLDTIDDRLANAVYRDGKVWTTHCVSQSGRAACRWYELNVTSSSANLVQSGTVSDASLYYFMPSISVNMDGNVAMGFSGSNASQFAGAYYCGRLSTDAPGEMSTPVQYRAGLAAHNLIDGFGRNRFGDYSLTTVDPADEVGLWTIQEYVQATNTWGTHVARLDYDSGPGLPDGVTAVCFGDGTGAVCPCVNFGGIGNGCTNSTGIGGALFATGSRIVLNDDLVLHASQCPPDKTGLFLQGASEIATPFRDGILCVGNPTERLEFVTTDGAGLASSSASIVTEGNITSSGVKIYQYWYRDGMGPCDQGSNLTHALAVDWLAF